MKPDKPEPHTHEYQLNPSFSIRQSTAISSRSKRMHHNHVLRFLGVLCPSGSQIHTITHIWNTVGGFSREYQRGGRVVGPEWIIEVLIWSASHRFGFIRLICRLQTKNFQHKDCRGGIGIFGIEVSDILRYEILGQQIFSE